MSLSARSETDEERSMRLQVQLHSLKLATEALLQKQVTALKAQQAASLISISQEGRKTARVNLVKSEFVNLIKVRKIIANRMN